MSKTGSEADDVHNDQPVETGDGDTSDQGAGVEPDSGIVPSFTHEPEGDPHAADDEDPDDEVATRTPETETAQEVGSTVVSHSAEVKTGDKDGTDGDDAEESAAEAEPAHEAAHDAPAPAEEPAKLVEDESVTIDHSPAAATAESDDHETEDGTAEEAADATDADDTDEAGTANEAEAGDGDSADEEERDEAGGSEDEVAGGPFSPRRDIGPDPMDHPGPYSVSKASGGREAIAAEILAAQSGYALPGADPSAREPYQSTESDHTNLPRPTDSTDPDAIRKEIEATRAPSFSAEDPSDRATSEEGVAEAAAAADSETAENERREKDNDGDDHDDNLDPWDGEENAAVNARAVAAVAEEFGELTPASSARLAETGGSAEVSQFETDRRREHLESVANKQGQRLAETIDSLARREGRPAEDINKILQNSHGVATGFGLLPNIEAQREGLNEVTALNEIESHPEDWLVFDETNDRYVYTAEAQQQLRDAYGPESGCPLIPVEVTNDGGVTHSNVYVMYWGRLAGEYRTPYDQGTTDAE